MPIWKRVVRMAVERVAETLARRVIARYPGVLKSLLLLGHLSMGVGVLFWLADRRVPRLRPAASY